MGRRITALPAWPLTPARTVCPEPSTTCLSLPLCTERATSEHSVSRPDSGPPAYLLLPPRPLTCPGTTLLSYYAQFLYVSGLIFFVIILCLLLLLLFLLLLLPPLHRSLTPCLRCTCFPRNAAALQVYKEGERKMFVSVFIFLL